MKAFRKIILFFVVVMGLLVLSCTTVASLPENILGSATPSSTATPSITPTPSLTPTPFYWVGSSRRIKLNGEGVDLVGIGGYKEENDDFTMSLVSEDRRVWVYAFTFPPVSGSTIKGVAKNIAKDISGKIKAEYISDPIPGAVWGVESSTIEMDGVDAGFAPITDSGADQLISFSPNAFQAGEVLHLKLTVFAPEHAKQFAFWVSASGDQRWEREGTKVYDTLYRNISFFPLVARQDCPISKDADYGKVIDKPVKVGGGEDPDKTRLHNYFGALLGPKNEIVDYWLSDTVSYNGATIYKYLIQYGTVRKNIFIDLLHFETLKAPAGLTCSVLFEQEP